MDQGENEDWVAAIKELAMVAKKTAGCICRTSKVATTGMATPATCYKWTQQQVHRHHAGTAV
jgi:hypothetical protein